MLLYKYAVTLITRLRRFGKTLNIDMLNCFFSTEYSGRVDLFEGMNIWKYDKYHELLSELPKWLEYMNFKTWMHIT